MVVSVYIDVDCLLLWVCCSVNVDLYENLISMGFNRRVAAEALKLSNNDLDSALQVCCSFDIVFLLTIKINIDIAILSVRPSVCPSVCS